MQNRSIVACIDGSTFTEAVCDYSSWMANNIEAPLTFLHTVEQSYTTKTDLSGAIGLGASEDLLNELAQVEQDRSRLLIQKGNLMLKAAKTKADEAGVNTVELRQLKGSLAESLVEMEENIRVLVIGIRGVNHQAQHYGLGAQLETIIRSLRKPILVVNNEFTAPKRIMLAYDGNKGSRKALEMVASSSLFRSAICHIVHVGVETSNSEKLLSDAAEMLSSAGIHTTAALLEGKPADCLATYQANNEIDLTLMGAFSHTRVRDFILGSFTAKMLEKTQRPLLLLR